MESIKDRWENFINTMANRLEKIDHKSAVQMRLLYTEETPPDESALEFAIASINFFQYGAEYLYTLTIANMKNEATLVAETLHQLNLQLYLLKTGTVVPTEFVKEIKLTRPL